MTWESIITNTTTLYVVGALAILNLIGYIATENTEGALCMVVIGILTAKFSKNMVVVFGTSLIATALLMGIQRMGHQSQQTSHKEPFEGHGRESTLPERGGVLATKASDFDKLSKTSLAEEIEAKAEGESSVASLHNFLAQKEDEPIEEGGASSASSVAEEDSSSNDPGTKPSSVSTSRKAKAIQEAFDSLENFEGGSGAAVDATEQKKQLVAAMKGLSPAMDKANALVDKVNNNPNIAKLVQSLAGLAEAIKRRVDASDSKAGEPVPASARMDQKLI